MSKPKTFEEAQAQFTEAKEALKTAKTELREFQVDNKIKKEKRPEDPKILQKLEKLEHRVETVQTAAETAKENLKELKPKKVRETKYEYPAGMTDADKKKFRAAARRKSKSDEKGKGDPKAGSGEVKKPIKKKLEKKEGDNTPDED
jgi:hypothetical protein